MIEWTTRRVVTFTRHSGPAFAYLEHLTVQIVVEDEHHIAGMSVSVEEGHRIEGSDLHRIKWSQLQNAALAGHPGEGFTVPLR